MKSETDRCLAELAAHAPQTADPSPRMIVSKLTLDGRAAAFEAGFSHRGAYYLYLRAFAPELAAFGPGNVLTEHMLGWCAENGIVALRHDGAALAQQERMAVERGRGSRLRAAAVAQRAALRRGRAEAARARACATLSTRSRSSSARARRGSWTLRSADRDGRAEIADRSSDDAGGAVAPEAPLDADRTDRVRRFPGRGRFDRGRARRARPGVAGASKRLSHAEAVFQSFAHIRFWARHFMRRKKAAPGFTSRSCATHGRAVLILPACGLAARRLLGSPRIAGDPIAQYAEVLVDPARASRGAFEAALASLRAAGVDAIVLRRRPRRLRISSASPRRIFGRQCRARVAPYRRSFRLRRLPGLSEEPLQEDAPEPAQPPPSSGAGRPFSFETLSGGAEARAAVADAIDLKRKWLVAARQPLERLPRSGDTRLPARPCGKRGERRRRDAPRRRRRGRPRSASASNMAARISPI